MFELCCFVYSSFCIIFRTFFNGVFTVCTLYSYPCFWISTFFEVMYYDIACSIFANVSLFLLINNSFRFRSYNTKADAI